MTARAGKWREQGINGFMDRAADIDTGIGAESAIMTAVLSVAPTPAPTILRTFTAMMCREVRVLRRSSLLTGARIVLQPLLFVLVFAYVMPKTGGGLSGISRDGTTFATILVPGIVSSTLFTQGLTSVTFPLVSELSFERVIEDRVLAPVPVWLLALEKIAAGAMQALAAALLVFPIALLIHAGGHAPSVHVTNWPLLAIVMLGGAVLSASLGLLAGTLLDVRKVQTLFALLIVPSTLLGCVYYPWAALQQIPWLKFLVLCNPMVYLSEALRAVLTPQLGHMSGWALLLALAGGIPLVGYVAVRSFSRRVLS